MFQVDGSEIALRRETARRLKVRRIASRKARRAEDLDERMQRLPRLRPAAVVEFPRSGGGAAKRWRVIGPPNSGKTTLFNRLTGLRQKVANFPGVTVEQHTGMAELPDGRAVQHHRSARHLQPLAALGRRAGRPRRATGQRADTPKPEAVLLVLDSTNLGRHLMLAAPILALGLPTLVILNMADDLRNRGGQAGSATRSRRELGAPVALVSARQGEGIEQVFDFLAGAMPKPAPRELPVLQDVPKCRAVGRPAWAARPPIAPPIAPKWTRRLDAVFLHPVAGPLVFAGGGGRRCFRPSSASPIRPRTQSTG